MTNRIPPPSPSARRRTQASWLLAALLLSATAGCATTDAADERPAPGATVRAFDAELAAELLALAADDQRYEHLVMDQDPSIRESGFFERKARLQAERTARCREIFAAHGFPGADLVGPDGSSAFWLLLQHADDDPDFQELALEAMAPLVSRGLADGSELAYLTDRVRVNTGRPQVYGTQVAYDQTAARPYPKPLERPGEVDARRAAAGIEPLWVYLNSIAESHHRMNQAMFEAAGIPEPWRYPDGFTDW